ncbi:MAG TPA: patatin-like phospholipase family protein [Bacilli bacterium]|nr:patatin-like phospholipase family protein [Bacilli bacterium]
MKRALVLSGGGARGSYEFGVWKALKELKIDFDIVTGVSIGAINGAIIAQNDYKIAESVWRSINTSDVFYFDYDLHTPEGQIKMYYQLAKNLIKDGGLALDKMEEILRKYIDEEKVRTSPIELAIITYSYTKKKAIIKKVKDIEKGKLIDYIIASATCFPIVQPKKIDDELFLDGGYYDAMPINLAIDMGAEEIIAVDLKGFGFNRRPKDRSKKLTIIKPNHDLGSILSFTKEDAELRMKLGYNDTMKTYDKYEGDIYTFYKNDLIKNYNKLSNLYQTLYKTYFKRSFISVNQHKEFRNISDNLGKIYNMDITRVYSIKKYNREILNKIINGTRYDNIKQKIIHDNFYNIMIEKDRKKANVNILALSKLFKYSLYLYTIYNKSNVFYKIKFKLKLRRRTHGSN